MAIQDPSTFQTAPPRVTFDWSPKAAAFSVTVGGNTYPWGANDPVAGAPDQADVLYTATSQLLTFVATVVYLAPGDSIREFRWDFGDGQIGYGQTVTHTYRASVPGLRCRLIVRDNHNRVVVAGRDMNLTPSDPINVSQQISVNQ